MRLVPLVLAVLPMAAVAQEAPPPGALSCGGCHGAASILPLEALSGEEIAAALLAYAEGSRDGTLMPRIAKGFTPDEIAAIAAWIAEGRE